MQTILIVEDDKTIAESIAFILEQDSFNCKWFDNGQGALEYLNNNEVGIVKTTLVKKEQDRIRKKLGFLNDKDSFKIDF